MGHCDQLHRESLAMCLEGGGRGVDETHLQLAQRDRDLKAGNTCPAAMADAYSHGSRRTRSGDQSENTSSRHCNVASAASFANSSRGCRESTPPRERRAPGVPSSARRRVPRALLPQWIASPTCAPCRRGLEGPRPRPQPLAAWRPRGRQAVDSGDRHRRASKPRGSS